ncbi:serine/threonine protein kinase [Nocardia colli]|uniref:non-specific serine/threonine protein kinase n=1 Tax=Nocardia colli TaxID=2545717 RepID=A0A5N0E992_9NOCA|nr:serine/threonine protein kinase [Nocardia colli]
MLGVGDSFAGYLVEGVLGQGGMGTVYRARHPRLPRLVALKLLNRAVSEDEELRRRFELEANVVARLDHPGIVGVYDRGTQDGHLWISMQYIAGTDAARLDPRAAPPGHVVQIVADTADALDYAHGRGVLHRDIKPANILLAESKSGHGPRAILTDFGIARLLDADTKLTATGTFTATLAYASPEQLSGEQVDHRADQYSLACTLFTLLAGQTPYPATNPGQIVAGHITKPVPRLSERRPDLPASLDEVIGRAMAKQRHERFASCSEFAEAARDALSGRPVVTGYRTAPTVYNTRPEPSPAVDIDPRRRTAPTMLNQHSNPVGASVYPGQMSPVADPPPPSGRTAKTAAVLALLFGLIAEVPAVGAVIELTSGHGTDAATEMIAIAAAVTALSALLIGGALALLFRKRGGRLAVAIGSAIVTLAGLAAVGAVLIDRDYSGLAIFGPVPVFSLTALWCATSHSTARWLAHRPLDGSEL